MRKLVVVLLVLLPMFVGCAPSHRIALSQPETVGLSNLNLVDRRPVVPAQPLEPARVIHTTAELGADPFDVLSAHIANELEGESTNRAVSVYKLELTTMDVDYEGFDADGQNYVSQADALGASAIAGPILGPVVQDIANKIIKSAKEDGVSVRLEAEYEIEGTKYRERKYGMAGAGGLSSEADRVISELARSIALKFLVNND